MGIAKAKAEGKYKGRAPTARAQAGKVLQLRNAGVGPSEIARQVGISRTSVFRILGSSKPLEQPGSMEAIAQAIAAAGVELRSKR